MSCKDPFQPKPFHDHAMIHLDIYGRGTRGQLLCRLNLTLVCCEYTFCTAEELFGWMAMVALKNVCADAVRLLLDKEKEETE